MDKATIENAKAELIKSIIESLNKKGQGSQYVNIHPRYIAGIKWMTVEGSDVALGCYTAFQGQFAPHYLSECPIETMLEIDEELKITLKSGLRPV